METSALVIELQRAVDQPHAKSEGALRQLAEEYAEKCEAINRQLSQAVDFLRKGYRGEAVRLARAGNLVAEAGALSFPGREMWAEIATMCGVTTSAVSIGLAREIDTVLEAYARVQPLADKLRFLNIRRAPIEERAAVLQELRRAEPENRMWQEGLDQLRNV